jgi:hypothetical protein
MNIDRRTLLAMLGSVVINSALSASAKPSVMDSLRDVVHSRTPFDFDIMTYFNLRGERMISYCFRTKTDRFQIAKIIDADDHNDISAWSTWTEKIRSDCPFASVPMAYDARFDPFMASGRPEQRG